MLSLKVLIVFIFIFFASRVICIPDAVSDEPLVLEVREFFQEEKDLQWVWGEVIEVDVGASELEIRYLDYESDANKVATFFADEDSEFENIVSIEEIKPGDSAGIDYYLSDDKRLIIKSINIEKLNIPASAN